MKRILCTALFAAAALGAMADETPYRYLAIQSNTTEQSVELTSVIKITFSDNNIVVSTTDGDITLPQSELKKLYFRGTPTAIDALPAQSKSLLVTNGVLTANGKGLLCLYNEKGALVQMARVENNTRVSLGNLTKGIYIISLNGETIKLIQK
ncbi:MAG: T9SS type A sorting domain-containing protein [Bacteroidales bacterium]|nr:T9SS type A sorting domain-containing protein [Candidatus Physcousia equi]